MSALLEARGLAIPDRLESCDLDLRAGEVAMLVGPNGTGKTSLLHALAGIGATAGDVSIDGQSLARMPLPRRFETLSYLGTSRDVTWPLIAQDFVALGISGTTIQMRVIEALETAGASQFADRRVDTLSTGERSRVMLARALAPHANVLLLDEPCANLEPKWQLHVIELLTHVARTGCAVLLSVHDLSLAAEYADRVIIVDRGKIVADGAPDETLNPHNIATIFGIMRDSAGRWRQV